jgi:hypothetical protein
VDKAEFEKVFSDEYRAMKQRQSDQGLLDVTELMWMVWQHAKAQGELDARPSQN